MPHAVNTYTRYWGEDPDRLSEEEAEVDHVGIRSRHRSFAYPNDGKTGVPVWQVRRFVQRRHGRATRHSPAWKARSAHGTTALT
ncbi:hypothetical protein EV192_1283 [Actinocrispum wychmicini]|uniref:Uncharacterized protein n=1 Tax=Actinocrispum wychmicini TaxID=1213861 RepID=A0A4V2S3B8_9PSEU|nr:hypothetical protein EV192_1283 [Actinocrispum wychmicini]